MVSYLNPPRSGVGVVQLYLRPRVGEWPGEGRDATHEHILAVGSRRWAASEPSVRLRRRRRHRYEIRWTAAPPPRPAVSGDAPSPVVSAQPSECLFWNVRLFSSLWIPVKGGATRSDVGDRSLRSNFLSLILIALSTTAIRLFLVLSYVGLGGRFHVLLEVRWYVICEIWRCCFFFVCLFVYDIGSGWADCFFFCLQFRFWVWNGLMDLSLRYVLM